MVRWQAMVRLKDVNGMETTVRVEVAADDREAAKAAAEAAALDEREWTGEHVSMTAEVDDEELTQLS